MKILENIDNVEEYNYLFDIVGWGSYPKEISKKALSNNIYSVSIYDNDNIIGYGRLIGDGIIFLYIHDIMVKPEYQGKGIGKTINVLQIILFILFLIINHSGTKACFFSCYKTAFTIEVFFTFRCS